MPAAEKPYTFRAPVDLADRMRDASGVLQEVAEAAGIDAAERIARQIVLALVRDRRRFSDARGNQSAFMRETIELLVGAAEKLAEDMRYAKAYAEVASEPTADEVQARRATRNKAVRRRRGA